MLAVGFLLVSVGNYISVTEIQKKINNLNLRVRSLEASRYYNEIKSQTEQTRSDI